MQYNTRSEDITSCMHVPSVFKSTTADRHDDEARTWYQKDEK